MLGAVSPAPAPGGPRSDQRPAIRVISHTFWRSRVGEEVLHAQRVADQSIDYIVSRVMPPLHRRRSTTHRCIATLAAAMRELARSRPRFVAKHRSHRSRVEEGQDVTGSDPHGEHHAQTQRLARRTSQRRLAPAEHHIAYALGRRVVAVLVVGLADAATLLPRPRTRQRRRSSNSRRSAPARRLAQVLAERRSSVVFDCRRSRWRPRSRRPARVCDGVIGVEVAHAQNTLVCHGHGLPVRSRFQPHQAQMPRQVGPATWRAPVAQFRRATFFWCSSVVQTTLIDVDGGRGLVSGRRTSTTCGDFACVGDLVFVVGFEPGQTRSRVRLRSPGTLKTNAVRR